LQTIYKGSTFSILLDNLLINPSCQIKRSIDKDNFELPHLKHHYQCLAKIKLLGFYSFTDVEFPQTKKPYKSLIYKALK